MITLNYKNHDCKLKYTKNENLTSVKDRVSEVLNLKEKEFDIVDSDG